MAHLKYLFSLEERGILLGSGPLDLDSERIEGMCIVRAATREDAEAIAAEEPYATSGWRENTVRAWQLNEGLLVSAVQAITSSTA
ncbi:MAG: uncharacterized protein QOC63_390 [Mycobacterium sp.]|nr:uncharacterized protein [Mycobacterium sp.]